MSKEVENHNTKIENHKQSDNVNHQSDLSHNCWSAMQNMQKTAQHAMDGMSSAASHLPQLAIDGLHNATHAAGDAAKAVGHAKDDWYKKTEIGQKTYEITQGNPIKEAALGTVIGGVGLAGAMLGAPAAVAAAGISEIGAIVPITTAGAAAIGLAADHELRSKK